jgi:hypothetical protein
MGNLTQKTKVKPFNGLTPIASNCLPNPTCQRYGQWLKKKIADNMKINKYLKLLFLLYSLFQGKNIIAQNLVPNPCFEQYSSCPDFLIQLSNCMGWSSYKETPDYFNNCSNVPGIKPPNSYFGFQYPHNGNGYAGIYCFVKNVVNDRELIGSQLSSSLLIGQKYFISFYVNLGGASQPCNTTVAANNMGVKFSTVPYSFDNPASINNTANFYTNTIIADTTKWTKISGSFIADSAYSYIIIGNFFDDTNTDTLFLAQINNSYAYYYIDDVCVSPDSLYAENWLKINEIENKKRLTIYPNPASDKIFISLNDKFENEISVRILNITGQQLLADKFENQNLIKIDISIFSKGVYWLEILYDNKLENRKLIIK